jgi:hypothetical protein
MSESDELRKELEDARAEIRRLEELQNIFRVWVGLRQKLFPSDCGIADVRGIDLRMMDSRVAGCASTFLMRGRLDQNQKEEMYYCNDSLDAVNLELQGYEGWYFRQLKALTSAIIDYQRKWD